MIDVRIYKDLQGIVHGFRVSGHACFSEKGSDIVCSAASMLVINTINCIEMFTAEKAEVMTDENDGIIECNFPERKNGMVDKDADLLIKSMIYGLHTVEVKYSGYIKNSEEAPI